MTAASQSGEEFSFERSTDVKNTCLRPYYLLSSVKSNTSHISILTTDANMSQMKCKIILDCNTHKCFQN